jgi:CheY-like chemotaxis protein
MSHHARRSGTNDAARPVVLVVEDEDLLRNTTAEYLRLFGYVVIEAANAAEAIEIFTSGQAARLSGLAEMPLECQLRGVADRLWFGIEQPI